MKEIKVINCGHCPCSLYVDEAPGYDVDDDLVCNLDDRPTLRTCRVEIVPPRWRLFHVSNATGIGAELHVASLIVRPLDRERTATFLAHTRDSPSRPLVVGLPALPLPMTRVTA